MRILQNMACPFPRGRNGKHSRAATYRYSGRTGPFVIYSAPSGLLLCLLVFLVVHTLHKNRFPLEQFTALAILISLLLVSIAVPGERTGCYSRSILQNPRYTHFCIQQIAKHMRHDNMIQIWRTERGFGLTGGPDGLELKPQAWTPKDSGST